MSFVPRGKNVCGPLHSRPVRLAQTPPPLDAINIERLPWPALPSYNNSVRTKVNALNLISVLVIFNGVVMHAKGGRNVEGRRQVWREICSHWGDRTEAKLITGLYKFNVMSHFL